MQEITRHRIVVFILLGIVIFSALVLFLFSRDSTLPPPDPNDTSTWEKYRFGEKIFLYPSDWEVEKIKGEGKNADGFRVYPSAKDLPAESVYVAGGYRCEEYVRQLCAGSAPVSTDSADPMALRLFEYFVRISESGK